MNADDQFADRFDPSGTTDLPGTSEFRHREAMPLILKIVLAVDIVFCLMRIPSVILSLFAARAQMQRGESPSPFLLLEFVCGTAIVLLGTSGDLMLLLRQAWATSLTYLSMVGTVGSIAAGVWATAAGVGFLMTGADQSGSIDATLNSSLKVGTIFATAMRLLTLGVYAKAIWGYSGWARASR
jgi:hypothetical protein